MQEGGQGGSSTTPTVPTTTETPATANPQTTPTPTPSTPVQPQQPSQTAKFSVDTLVGGAGQGDVDGSVNVAKINAVDSMVMDKDSYVYPKKLAYNNANNGIVFFVSMTKIILFMARVGMTIITEIKIQVSIRHRLAQRQI